MVQRFFYKLMREMTESKGALDAISYRFTFNAYRSCNRKVFQVI